VRLSIVFESEEDFKNFIKQLQEPAKRLGYKIVIKKLKRGGKNANI